MAKRIWHRDESTVLAVRVPTAVAMRLDAAAALVRGEKSRNRLAVDAIAAAADQVIAGAVSGQ